MKRILNVLKTFLPVEALPYSQLLVLRIFFRSIAVFIFLPPLTTAKSR